GRRLPTAPPRDSGRAVSFFAVHAGSSDEDTFCPLPRNAPLRARPAERVASAGRAPAPSPLARRRFSSPGRGGESGAGTLGKLPVDLPGPVADRAHPVARPEPGRARAASVRRRPAAACRAQISAGAPHLDVPQPG